VCFLYHFGGLMNLDGERKNGEIDESGLRNERD
jgi:hypothetical protein